MNYPVRFWIMLLAASTASTVIFDCAWWYLQLPKDRLWIATCILGVQVGHGASKVWKGRK